MPLMLNETKTPVADKQQTNILKEFPVAIFPLSWLASHQEIHRIFNEKWVAYLTTTCIEQQRGSYHNNETQATKGVYNVASYKGDSRGVQGELWRSPVAAI
mmetsp:Transcript_12120/g.20586  ORF Transcript_12120/g.20586 Transcript_12120/m.20586 type:complete len:101 (+) Transcript_12120:642-944(+)